jgi:UDP-N-acetylmuramate--alanine ligase
LFKDFLSAFNQADILVLTDIYPAGEDPLPGVKTETLFQGIKKHGHKQVHYFPRKEKIVDHILKLLNPGDVVITLGAGDIWQVGEQLQHKLKGLS